MSSNQMYQPNNQKLKIISLFLFRSSANKYINSSITRYSGNTSPGNLRRWSYEGETRRDVRQLEREHILCWFSIHIWTLFFPFMHMWLTAQLRELWRLVFTNSAIILLGANEEIKWETRNINRKSRCKIAIVSMGRDQYHSINKPLWCNLKCPSVSIALRFAYRQSMLARIT